jgi:hypothetical protein
MEIMKRRTTALGCLLFLVFTVCNVRAQRMEDFQNDFQRAADSGFDSVSVSGLLGTYQRFLMPFNQVVQLATAMKGQEMVKFPLAWMKATGVYKDNINVLLDAKNPDKRVLGYLMVAASGDVGKRNRLSRDLRAGGLPGVQLWLGMGLMHLGYDHTSDLFQWVARTNVQAGGYLFPLLITLQKDSLRQTAYRFSESKDWTERVYAIQALEYTGQYPKTEKILRKAIATWPMHLKGYAIVPAKALQIGNLLPALKPVLDSAATRKVALDALADSPTPSDRAFVSQLAKTSPPDPDVLNALKGSRYEAAVIEWLGHLPALDEKYDYFFTTHRDSVLRRDAMLAHVQKTAIEIRNPDVLGKLLPALKGRQDSLSQKLLTGFLTHKDHQVRWAAGNTLKGTCSVFLKNALAAVIADPKWIDNNTFELAAGCGQDGYREAAEMVYRSPEGHEHMAQTSGLAYLATYPQAKHLTLFREAIQKDPHENLMETRTAARGLAALGDTESLEAIIAASEKERKNSDMNTLMYLDAIALLKSDRSKTYLESFLQSDSDMVKKRVEAILEKW